MGLAMVHGIVKSCKGDIKVYSEPSKGSVFHVVLPRVEAAVPESGVAAHRAPRGHESVLLVDDEAALREPLADYLIRQGFAVSQAASAAQGLIW